MRSGRLCVLVAVVAAALAATMSASTSTAAGAGCFEPVPDPFAAGWSRDPSGSGGSVTSGFTPLTIDDPSTGPGAFVNLVCADAALFDEEIVLTPRVHLDFFTWDLDNSTGVHVTINDGVRLIRAALLRGPTTAQVRVAILKQSGRISTGFTFNTLTAEFTLRRLVNGDAVLEVAGQPPETVPAEQLPPTAVTTKRLEFGTYDTTAASASFWERLGLPQAALSAALDLEPDTINLKSRGAYVTGYIESAAFGIADIDPSTVTLEAVSPVTSAPLPVAAGAPTAVGDRDGDGAPDLMVKFDRAAVQGWFGGPADAVVRVLGRLADGRSFRGEAPVRVIDEGEAHTDEVNPASVRR